MKAIKKLVISLVVIVAVLGVVVIGGYIYVRSAYGIDLFRTAGQLKTLTEQVNEGGGTLSQRLRRQRFCRSQKFG